MIFEVEPRGALSETSQALIKYCEAFFTATKIIGYVNGYVSYIGIKAWKDLYEIAMHEREDGMLVVLIRDRIKNSFIASKQFNYLREPEKLFLDVNEYLEQNGVI